MATRESPQAIMDKIIALILAKKLVHYSDIQEYTGLSKRTVAKYLKDTEKFLASKGLKLVRKRNKGIYIEGDISLLQTISPQRQAPSNISSALFGYLLAAQRPVLIEELADMFFVSRSTLLRKIDYLKEKYELEISSSKYGIWINTDTSAAKDALSNFIQQHIHSEIIDNNGVLHYNYELDDHLGDFLADSTFKKVEQVITEFMRLTAFKIERREYELFLIHTVAEMSIYLKTGLTNSKSEFADSENLNLYSYLLNAEFNCPADNGNFPYVNRDLLIIENYNLKRNFMANNIEITKANLREILERILDTYDDTLIDNLANHLRELIGRAKLGVSVPNPYQKEIKNRYPAAFDRALLLGRHLKQIFNIEASEGEIAFLALHFESFIRRQDVSDDRIRAVIVCSTGYGSSVLLKQEIEYKYGRDIHVIRTMSEDELITQGFVDADLIISTISINYPKMTVVKVSPLLTDQDTIILEQKITTLKKKKYDDNVFLRLIKRKNILFVDDPTLTPEQAITKIVNNLKQAGYVHEGMLETALKREEQSSTELRNAAIPHGDPRLVIIPSISILLNRSGMQWGKNHIKAVFFIAVNEQLDSELDRLYQHFYLLVRDNQAIERIAQAHSAEEVLKIIDTI
ncbi:BglG family transcription antiterminator [Ligilactobacillus saerimneri]|uniref:BglG family transcription antiterminator n=1 Tax=Ligilactobacillus saerimneri TaxID=228229 RepID=UPI0004237EB4|nr:PTS sugar transporter subunit IIA [Ligilactobacillus saerimneri]